MQLHLRVTAVVVAHNGAEYLPATLGALARQSRPADFCVGVDTGSTDGSASILQLGLPTGSPVVGAPARAGFGTAVRTAVAEIPVRRTSGEAAAHDWLWLLHDDSAPEPGALAELLLAVERAPSVTVAGAKQVAWDDRRELVDVGLSISRWAERLTLIDVDEHDQGQYDARSDVFAVNSAGMLVRRDVWDALDGFDPAFHGVGDDVDLCWRNRLAGNRVVVVPAAVLHHATARPHPVATPRAARAAEVYLRLKHAAPWNVPLLAVGAVLGGMARLLLGLLAKDPAHGTGQLLGSLAGVARPVQLWRSRRSAARSRQRPRSIVRPLITSRRDVWSHRRSVVDAFTSRGAGGQDGQGTEEYIPSGNSNDDFAALATPTRLWVGAGAVLAVVVLLAAALVGLHRLVGASALAGGALLPAAATPGAIWANATSWWTGLGAGFAAHGSPFSYVLWVLSLLGLGSANTAIVVTVVCALPLAGLSAWFTAGALTRSRGLRLWAALFWGAAPALQVALGGGRLGALIAHILLPLALLGLVRAVGAGLTSRTLPDGIIKPGINGTRSWTAGAAAGLVLAAVTACAPSLLPVVVVGLVVALIVGRRRARVLWWALLPVLALHLPYALSAVGRPRGILGDPGVPSAFDPGAPWQHLLGFPVSFDPMLPPAAAAFLGDGPWSLVAAVVIGAPVIVLAAAALFLPRGRRTLVRSFWLLAVLALALAAVAPVLPVAAGTAVLIPVFPGPLVSVVSLGLLAAALSGLPGRRDADAPAARPRRLLPAAAGAVLAVGPLLSLGLWLAPELAGPPAVAAEPVVIAGSPAEEVPDPATGTTDFGTAVGLESVARRPLPATAADRGSGPDQTRTLVITVDDDDDVAASLMRGSGTTLDALNPLYSARTLQGGVDVAPAKDSEAVRVLRTTVAVIVGATGADPRGDLRDLGVGFVVLQQSETAGDFLSGRIDSVPGLTAVGDTDAGRLWRVVPATRDDGTEDEGDRTARVRVVGADGRTEATVPSSAVAADGAIPAGAEGRRLVLAEEAAAGWQASLDGERLEATSDDWRQAFALPAAGGTVTVSYVSPYQPWAGGVQAVVLGLTVLLAVPIPSRPRVALPKGGRRPRPAAGSGRAAGETGVDGGTGTGAEAHEDQPHPATSGSSST
ncbi:glycosyltransferase [Arthrobacter sp. NPDC092385]|uniref:glycosyltransferase n=1 Tax=Arthrobacter sp. NPDC092385 TaxID=3363943 RepID=UPI00382FF5B4